MINDRMHAQEDQSYSQQQSSVHLWGIKNIFITFIISILDYFLCIGIGGSLL
jgi:hypothetical protein